MRLWGSDNRALEAWMKQGNASEGILLSVIRDQQAMIKELNDRLMARDLPEYGLFRKALADYPELIDKIETLVDEAREKRRTSEAFGNARMPTGGEPEPEALTRRV
jgi:hypothetical protein